MISESGEGASENGGVSFDLTKLPENASIKINRLVLQRFAVSGTAMTFTFPIGKVTLTAEMNAEMLALTQNNEIILIIGEPYVFFTVGGRTLAALIPESPLIPQPGSSAPG